MTPKERMRTAMALGQPAGRVPVMCQMSIGHMLLRTGIPAPELWFEAEAFVAALLRLRADYAFDGILVSLHGHAPDWRAGAVRLRRAGEDWVLDGPAGGRIVFPPDDLPRPEAGAGGGRPAIRAFDPGALPGEIAYIPVSQGLRFAIDPDRPFEAIDLVLARAGREFSIHGEVTSPLDYFLDLFGFAEGFLALADEPERSRAVLDRLAEGVARLAGAIARRGVDAVKISSPYAGAGFLSPAHYREFVLPAERRIAAAVRAEGAFVYTHTCGRIGDRLELIVEAGVSGLECLDPPPLGNVELLEAKRRIGRRAFIKGNVDPVNVLLPGPPDRIARDARARLAAGAAGGGFILSTACSIAPRTPAENVRALARAVAEAGR